MRNSQRSRHRGAFSYLELQVAFALFALTLSGIGPLVVMQSRQLQALENRFDSDVTYYLTPRENKWARKLGAGAGISPSAPGPPATASVTLIDNTDAGYTEVDTGTVDWHTVVRATAYDGEFRRQNGWTGADQAFWNFTNLRPGWYQVFATWGPAANQATNAPFTVYDGGTAVATVTVNQRQAPSGPAFDGSPWESLGVYLIGGGSLRVRLTDDANGFIAADAIRIVPITNDLVLQTVQKSLTQETITATVSVVVNTP